MDDIVFNNLEELYKRLLPALKNKKHELELLGINYIEELDIWNYLKDKKWSKANNLLLYQMVDDIINLDSIILIDFYKKDSD